jgi:putative transposase
MHFSGNEFYHIYNRGNNKQTIFFNQANYLFFLRKVRLQLLPVAKIVSYCLMPNHFHFMIMATSNSVSERKSFGGKGMQELSYRIGILLSSYSQAINKQNATTGSLFQQKTKCKILREEINGEQESYLETCFFYIHQNPVKAGIVTELKDWPYSSYADYAGLRNGTLCNKELFYLHSGLRQDDIIRQFDINLPEKEIENIF